MKKHKVAEWKPVQLSGLILSKGVEGLVGIEELHDYSVINREYKKAQKGQFKERKKKHDDKKDATKKRKRQDTPKNEMKYSKETVGKRRKNSSKALEFSVEDNYKNKNDEIVVTTPEMKYSEETVGKRRKNRSKALEFSVEDNYTNSNDDSTDTDELSELHDNMSAWNGLGIPDSILRALEEQGFKEPTTVQVRTLPPAIMGRRDILGAAETGSGKTLAFGIPILHHILEDKTRHRVLDETSQSEDVEEEESENDEEEVFIKDGTNSLGCVQVINNIPVSQSTNTSDSKLQALILTPTRELAIQIKNHLKAAARYTGIKIAVVVGGMSIQKQERLLSLSPEIVVATPGRLWEMIQSGNSHLAQVGNIKYLAVDETDRMLEKGHFQELRNLLEVLNVDEKNKKRRQNFVFSATLTMVHDPPKHLKGQKKKLKITPGQKLQSMMTALGITNPKIIDITNDSGTADHLTEARIMCTFEEKDFYLYYFLQRHQGRTLIFCNSISCVRRLAQLLTLLKCSPLPLHANMVQRQRLKNLDRFRDNPHGILLATDVAARGLDIPNVQYVVHYQVPRTSESYVHRSGRTARAQKQGLALLLIEPAEAHYYANICQTLGRSKDLPLFPVINNALDAAKKRVALAREVDKLELVSRRSTSETGWFRKALTEMDMLVDEDDVPRQLDDDVYSMNRRLAAAKKKQLIALLSKPMFVSSVMSGSPDPASAVVPFQSDSVKQNKKRRKMKKWKKDKH